MKTFQEWLAERQQHEGLHLNTDGRIKDMALANPFPKDSAFKKSLKQKPKAVASGVPVFRPYQPAKAARWLPYKPPEPAKMVRRKRR